MSFHKAFNQIDFAKINQTKNAMNVQEKPLRLEDYDGRTMDSSNAHVQRKSNTNKEAEHPQHCIPHAKQSKRTCSNPTIRLTDAVLLPNVHARGKTVQPSFRAKDF